MTPAPLIAVSSSEGQTVLVGRVVGELARPGDVVVLVGELGAGKTVFAKGLAAGLGIDDVVVSPTFVLVRTVKGRITLHHADLWRLEDAREIDDLGLGQLAEEGAVVAVEWGDKAGLKLGRERLQVTIEVADEASRTIVLEGEGASWEERWPALAERLRELRATAVAD